MLSRAIYRKQRGRRPLTALAVVTLVTGLFIFSGTAFAVHDLDFQLDGDVSVNCPAALPLCTSAQKDWTDMFTVATNATTQTISLNTPITTTHGTFTNATFTRDFRSGAACTLNSASTTFCTSDTTTYATGSKDTLDMNTGWACNFDHNVNSKIDIMNAYSAAFTRTSDSHKFLYFGLEKNKDNGTNDAGFWFLQGDANCDASGGGHPAWTGAHTPGDVLIVAEYSTGGGIGNITAYRWDPTVATNLSQISTAVAPLGDCKNNLGSDALCATTNSGAKAFNTNITTPWLTADATLGVGNTVVPPDFFEGGIDLTAAFQGTGTPPPSCFNTFIADTRSSTSKTATLFDYARGSLGQCTQTLTTSAAGTASGSIGTGSVNSGTDTATLTITGTPTWGGDLTWYLCGPVTTDGCDNTGVLVTTRTVNQDSPATDFVSGTATLTSVGRYCWTAHFEPNAASKLAGLTAKDDNGVGECFDVAPVTPTLPTSATCSASPCILGSTLTDTATLTGAASQPGSGGPSTAYPTINPATPGAAAGGTITWVLYAPSNGGCTDTRTTTPTSRTVSGNGPYSVTYTTLNNDPVGTYTFVANYGGNGPNTNAAATVTCAAPGANETVTVVGSASVATAQRWLPNDRIVLSSNGPTMTGTLTATLYSGTFSGTADNCTSGTATAVTGQSYSFTLSNTASGTPFNTTNTTFFVGTKADGTAGAAPGTYFWLIHVDTQLTDPADSCETSTVSITN